MKLFPSKIKSFATATAFIAILVFTSCSSGTKKAQKKDVKKRPNFLLVVADDLGWTDINSFGSEVKTPNIDALAESGVTMTNFHVSVSSSPTRSMLLTGTDNHIAGMGNMAELMTDEQSGKPGYEGHLNERVVTLAEVLREEGYHTYMSGKWHLGEEIEHIPAARGFENSFTMLFGGASYWSDMSGLLAGRQEVARYFKNHTELDTLPKDFYATRSYTDTLMDMIRENKDDGKPFLGYLAYTAVHDPLHVPEPWMSQYKGEYNDGYAALKKRRANGAIKQGVFPADATPAELFSSDRVWESYTPEQRAFESKAMEVYAGMISNMDYHIGRVTDFLKDIGEYENTVIIFMSDNGSNPSENKDYSPGPDGERYIAQFDNSTANLGGPTSHYAYGPGWGSACSGPLNYFKMTPSEGGTRSPLIICGPGITGQKKVDAFAYVTDIMPSILEMAKIEHPGNANNSSVEAMRGRSLTPLLSGTSKRIYGEDEILAGELGGGKWVQVGDYKAITVPRPYGDGEWQLYNITRDPGETNNLAASEKNRLNELLVAWGSYAEEVGVVEIGSGGISM